jgi:TPR repeat protein
MAVMYLDGQGTSQDLIQAYHLFKECSHLGYSDAINIFSIPINYAKSTNIDYRTIETMFVTVCKQGINSLEYNLGNMYSQNHTYLYNNAIYSIIANPFKEEAWCRQAADQGSPMALYKLGIYFETKSKKTSSQDLSKTVSYFQRAYTIGNMDATYKLASMYLNGYGVSQDLRKAFTLLNEATDMGHKRAYGILNNLDIDGEEYKLDVVNKMLEISAESGHVLSQYKLGVLTSDPRLPYYNTKDAIKWLQMVVSYMLTMN